MRPVPYGGRSTTPSGTSQQGDAGALAKFLVSPPRQLAGDAGAPATLLWQAAFESPWTFESVRTKRSAAPGGLRGVGLTPLQGALGQPVRRPWVGARVEGHCPSTR